MSPGASTQRGAEGDRAPQFEVIPLRGIVDQVLAELPGGTRVTVTASPAQGLDATLEVACALSRQGIHAIPHLAARMLRGPAEVAEVLDRLGAAGVDEVFVIAGDAPRPAGPFDGALDLLEALSPSGVRAGIGAHPEGHPFVDDAESMRLLRAKAEHAAYVVTQMSFEAESLLAWTRRLRREGIPLPVRPGIAAPASTARLLRIGARIGVGRSLRLLGAQRSGMHRLLGPEQWDPGPLLAQLAAAGASEPELALDGPHLYTFNAVRAAREALSSR